MFEQFIRDREESRELTTGTAFEVRYFATSLLCFATNQTFFRTAKCSCAKEVEEIEINSNRSRKSSH